jgi:hypothetical protein
MGSITREGPEMQAVKDYEHESGITLDLNTIPNAVNQRDAD